MAQTRGSWRLAGGLLAVALVASCASGRVAQTGGGTTAPIPGASTTASPSTAVPPATTAAPTSTTAAPTSTSGPPTPFTWGASALSAPVRAGMVGVSWRPVCPVPLDDLRLVSLTYWGFDGLAHQGQLVVHADAVSAIVEAFRTLFTVRFPIRQMRLVDDFAGDDERSMAMDNTSAFNCRLVPSTTSWAQHAYGRAVDINPLENPWVSGGVVDPPGAGRWVDRTITGPGVIRHGDAVWRAFAAVGWEWGGDWRSLKDYQHFSANGL